MKIHEWMLSHELHLGTFVVVNDPSKEESEAQGPITPFQHKNYNDKKLQPSNVGTL